MQQKHHWKDHLKATFIMGAVRIMALPPFGFMQKVGATIGWFLWRFNVRLAKISRINIKLCLPQLTDNQAEELVKKSLIETGKTAGEMSNIWTKPPNISYQRIIAWKNEDLFKQAITKGRGVIALAPHLGNWEIIVAYVSKHYKPIALYRPPRIELLNQWIIDARERSGIQMIPATREGIKDLPGLLKQGRNIFILPDQEPSKGHGEFAPFFGTPALSMRLASRLVRETNASVVCIYGKRLKKGFEIVFRDAEPEIYDPDPSISIAAMNKSVENCILDIPEQYQWSYKRFKTRPEGYPKLYRL